MIDAYTGAYPVEVDTYGLPDSKGGLSPVVGFTRPPAKASRAWQQDAAGATDQEPGSGCCAARRRSLALAVCGGWSLSRDWARPAR
jgi:hypothetical protein